MLTDLRLARCLIEYRLWEKQKNHLGTRFAEQGKSDADTFLFLFIPNRIPEAQLFPFLEHRKAIRKHFHLDVQAMDVLAYEKLEQSVDAADPNVKFVGIQTWFDWTEERLGALFSRLRSNYPEARFVYFDWFAPTDLRMAPKVDRYVDRYVKKNLLRDFSEYSKSHIGDTNLTDYYSRLYGLKDTEKQYLLPKNLEAKVLPGPSFITSPLIRNLLLYCRPSLASGKRSSLHARLGGSDGSWYGHMREHARTEVARLGFPDVVSEGMTGQFDYLKEMQQSRMTFSPFGYGEVCWRDFEAMALGSLLIKPDMSHLTLEPDLFLPGETYIPIAWDFSDFREKAEHYLSDKPNRIRIAGNALEMARNYHRGQAFMQHVEKILN